MISGALQGVMKELLSKQVVQSKVPLYQFDRPYRRGGGGENID